ncbi:DUF1761 domain-containing protein [Pelagibius litoralis]|uniref:DUF1761 domain-containing protein n=1 Tax=Pelagibius litoralis TaxID=374515 RepID=A0A967F0B2_9PROT|nr:DUF1761 domain-containing protein [Pelagibius litoralis]NIA70675.1 DUF1761 domain-containing protein [Pelagibius litoralis]
MEFTGINYLAVVAAMVASYVFGSVYYMSLAKPWMAALGKTEEEVKAGAGPSVYVITAIAQLVMAFMLAGIMGHLGSVGMGAAGGLTTAFFVWLGFVATTLVVNHGFQGAKRSLTVIDGAHWLGVLLVQGLVIGLFGI